MYEIYSNETQIEKVKRVMTWLRGNKRVNERTRKRAVAWQRDETDPISSMYSLSLQSQEPVTVTLRMYYPSFTLCESRIYNIRSLELEQMLHSVH